MERKEELVRVKDIKLPSILYDLSYETTGPPEA
jgi:hypothetical protein